MFTRHRAVDPNGPCQYCLSNSFSWSLSDHLKRMKKNIRTIGKYKKMSKHMFIQIESLENKCEQNVTSLKGMMFSVRRAVVRCMFFQICWNNVNWSMRLLKSVWTCEWALSNYWALSWGGQLNGDEATNKKCVPTHMSDMSTPAGQRLIHLWLGTHSDWPVSKE